MPQWGDRFEFLVVGDIADVITHAKFYVSRLEGFGVLTPQNLSIYIGLAGGSYNSVSTATLHCDNRKSYAAYCLYS